MGRIQGQSNVMKDTDVEARIPAEDSDDVTWEENQIIPVKKSNVSESPVPFPQVQSAPKKQKRLPSTDASKAGSSDVVVQEQDHRFQQNAYVCTRQSKHLQYLAPRHSILPRTGRRLGRRMLRKSVMLVALIWWFWNKVPT